MDKEALDIQLNCLLAQVIFPLTASLRSDAALNVRMSQFALQPRGVTSTEKAYPRQLSVAEFVMSVLQPASLTAQDADHAQDVHQPLCGVHVVHVCRSRRGAHFTSAFEALSHHLQHTCARHGVISPAPQLQLYP